MLIRKLRWLGMEEEAQGLEDELSDGALQLRTAFSQQLPKRINQQAPAPAAFFFFF